VQTGIATRQGNLEYLVGDYSQSQIVPATVDQAWPALMQAYQDLELGPGRIDPASHTLGHSGLVAARRLVGERLSRLFNCGSNMTGPVANQSRITLVLDTRLEALEDSAVLVTLVEGTAVPFEATEATGRRCASTGLLEQRIHERLLERLAGPT